MSMFSSYTPFKPRSEGQSLVACICSHSAQILIVLRGHSFRGCFYLYLGQNISITFSKYSCFYLACKVSIYKANELKMSVLRLFNIFPNSTQETPLDVVSDALWPSSQMVFPFPNPFEYLLQSPLIFLKSPSELSPPHIKFIISIHSSFIPLRKRVF